MSNEGRMKFRAAVSAQNFAHVLQRSKIRNKSVLTPVHAYVNVVVVVVKVVDPSSWIPGIRGIINNQSAYRARVAIIAQNT
jgi:hypothetical protein